MPIIITENAPDLSELGEQPLLLSLAPGKLDIAQFDAEVNRIADGSRIDPLKFIVIEGGSTLADPLIILSSKQNRHTDIWDATSEIYPDAHVVCAGLYFKHQFGDESSTLEKAGWLKAEDSNTYKREKLAPMLEGTGLSVNLR